MRRDGEMGDLFKKFLLYHLKLIRVGEAPDSCTVEGGGLHDGVEQGIYWFEAHTGHVL